MKRETVIAGSVFAAIPVVVLSAALFATRELALGGSHWWRIAFRPLCHGIPSRCLVVWGTHMPICARCTAIYIGLFAGLAAFFLMPWIEERLLRIAMYFAAAPLVIDGVTQAVRLRESTNTLRLVTGALASFAFGMWVLSAIERPAKTGSAAP